MVEPKINEDLKDLAQRLVAFFSDGRPEPYITKEESEKVLYPVIAELRVEIRYPRHEKWFKDVDTNKDNRIDVMELARSFQKINNFKERPNFEELRKKYEIFKNPNWVDPIEEKKAF